MANFNKPVSRARQVQNFISKHPRVTVNYEGGIAFTPEPEMDLYLRVASSMLADGFYINSTNALSEISALIRANGKPFVGEVNVVPVPLDRGYVLALAAYARNQLHLRGVSHVLFAEGARLYTVAPNEPKNDVIRQAWNVIQRPDDAAEILAYYSQNFGRTFTHSMLKGIAKAMTKFDEYQLAKYDRPGMFKLRDIVRLTHPPKYEKFRKLLARELPTPKTWEVEVAAHGNNAKTWNGIADNMGIFALLRNLSHFEKTGAEYAIKVALKAFNDPERVRNSRILPFRWYEAAKHVERSDIQVGLRTAFEHSISALPTFDGDMKILVDGSESMNWPIGSKRSRAKRFEIAAILAAILVKRTTGRVSVVSFSKLPKEVVVSKLDSALTTAQKIASAAELGPTYTYRAIEAINEKFDYVSIISDEEGYSDERKLAWDLGNIVQSPSSAKSWMRYIDNYGPTKLFSVNVAGYGTVQFPREVEGVIQVGGISENILHMLKAIEESRDAVAEIKREWRV